MRKPVEAFTRLGGEIHILGHAEDGGAVQWGDLKIVFSWGDNWDHVSVSCADRCPTWDEMERVKRAFFKDKETAMQLHVPVEDHISYHPYCLHLWRPQRVKIPRPPSIMVAPAKPKGKGA